MDLNTVNKNSNTVDAQTPPLCTQPTIKSLTFTDGSFKRHVPAQPQTSGSPELMVVCYKECLRNHAASMGGYAVDGCGEFMSSATFDSDNPTSLKCAACGCHRNFHRRETQDSNPNSLNHIYPLPQAAPSIRSTPPRGLGLGLGPSSSTSRSASPSIPSPESSPSPPPISQFSAPSYYASAPHMLLALVNTHGTAPTEKQHWSTSFNITDMKTENPSGKKRSRTQFSREQKEKMYQLSEKLGWKMQKVKEKFVLEFCDEIGVSRSVFKVWMHNNKNTFRKSSETNMIGTDRARGANDDGTLGFSSNMNGYNFDSRTSDIQVKEDSSMEFHVSANESSH